MKISEAKEIFPSITLVIIERIFEYLVSTDYLVLEGKSRVKLFAITDKIKSHCVDNVDAPAPSVKEIIATKNKTSTTKKLTQSDDTLDSKSRNTNLNDSSQVRNVTTPLIACNSEINLFETIVSDALPHQSMVTSEDMASGVSKNIVYQIVYSSFEGTSRNGGDGTASTEDVCRRAVEAGCSSVDFVKNILAIMVDQNKIMIDDDCIIEI